MRTNGGRLLRSLQILTSANSKYEKKMKREAMERWRVASLMLLGSLNRSRIFTSILEKIQIKKSFLAIKNFQKPLNSTKNASVKYSLQSTLLKKGGRLSCIETSRSKQKHSTAGY